MTTEPVDWNFPTQMAVGPGRIAALPEFCQQQGIRAPLIVTDPGLAALPMVTAIKTACDDAGMTSGVFADVQGNPTLENVEAGVVAFHAGDHDGVVALGGGSALDAGKAIAFASGQNRPLWDFVDVEDGWMLAKSEGIAPIIAVPTTAGTGSEVGRISVITDSAQHQKRLVFHPQMQPSVVILDPELTLSLPSHLTAATGMDALSHSLEAYCTPAFHPMAEGIALRGIRLTQQYLARAVHDGSDLEARTQLLVASSMGATAFQKGLGAMHALAHPMGAHYNAHHGLLNAIVMPYVLHANRSAIEPKITELARYLNLKDPSFDAFFDWVVNLRTEIGIAPRLLDIGIDDSDAELIGEEAAVDPTAATNPIAFSPAQYSALFRNAVNGEFNAIG
ncbi:iron-containing alcohol dehydrogenase [Luminiphilus sp. nBUS_07]|uniref:iron-containing alcohol dehydrogenase n=1 Tax=Luminiphilus sp. nBUS_07 TaxID=3395314 RepID=UPI003EB8423D